MTDPAREPAAAGSARYPIPAIALHWLIAAAIVLQVVLSYRITGPHTPESFAVTQLHKSIGITILLLSLARLGWRLANPPAPLPTTLARWEVVLARVVHVGFYGIMIGMPLTGWLMVSASRIALPTLLYGTVPWPNLPVSHLAPAARMAWHDFAEAGHGLLGDLIYVLLALHVAGALKHQLFSRDEPILARMAPGAVAGRWYEPRLLAIVLGFLGVVAFGWFVTPPGPRMAARPAAAIPQGPAQEPAAAPAAPAGHDMPPATAPATPTPDAGPVTWAVEPGSTLGFASSWSGQPINGRFDKWSAQIVFSPDALDRSKLSVSIDLASVNTGDQQRDAVLPSPDWFDAAAHPKAVFTATRFEKLGGDRYLAHGTLQLKGASKPQDLAFRLKIAGDRAEATGTASLDRTAFAVGQGEFAATDQIPGKVAVTVALKARRR
jgi:cytochrome b561/polyisoprenoid-binding protein YceI